MHQHKLAYWKQVIIDCRTSGLTANEYMRRHGIKKAAFYYWLRKIREELLEEHPEYLHQPKPSGEADTAGLLPTSGRSAEASVPVKADAVPAASTPLPAHAGSTPAPSTHLPEFIAVRASTPLPRDKLLVSIYSLVETSKASSIDPEKYLRYVLTEMPGRNFMNDPEMLEGWMPWSKAVQDNCKA